MAGEVKVTTLINYPEGTIPVKDSANIFTGQNTFNNYSPIIGPATASRVASFGTSKELVALSTTTYPSLAELAFVKGLTSAVQTQLDGKPNIATPNEFTGDNTFDTPTYFQTVIYVGGNGAGTVYVYDSANNVYRPITSVDGGINIYGSGLMIAVGEEENQTYYQGSNSAAAARMSTNCPVFSFEKGLMLPYVAKTGTYAIARADSTIHCTTGTFTVTLPTAVGFTGQVYTIKNTGAGVITLATTSSQTIDGLTTQTLATGVCLRVQSTGANWILI